VEHCFRPEQKAIENGELCLIVFKFNSTGPKFSTWKQRYVECPFSGYRGRGRRGTMCNQSVLAITTYNKTFSPNQIHKLATGEGGG